MGWNGSQLNSSANDKANGVSASVDQKRNRIRSSRIILVVSFLVVAIIVVYIFRSPSESAPADLTVERTPKEIKEIAASPLKKTEPNLESKSVKKIEKEEKDTRPTYRDERGILRYEGGMRVPGQRPVAKPVDIWANKPKIFDHDAEDTIAGFIQMRIGDPVIGELTYGEEFVKSFKEALVAPTSTSEKDDEYTKELKKAVSETMSDLNERMKAGEDVAKILNDTRKEYQLLGQYKHELETQLSEIQNNSEEFTDQDLADFTAAANEMLKQKGLPPLALPRAVAIGLKLKGIQR